MSLPHYAYVAFKVEAWILSAAFWLFAAFFIKDSGVNVALIMASSALITLCGGIFMWYMGHKWQLEASLLAAKVATDSAKAVNEVKTIATQISVNVDGRLSEALKAMKELAHAQGRREGSEAERDMK